jgi:hypothetical protein
MLLITQGRRGNNHLFGLSAEGQWQEFGAERGIDDPGGRGRTPLFLDGDNDGDLDLLLPKLAPLNEQLPTSYLEQGEDGFFTYDPSIADFGDSVQASFAQLIDLDGDGHCELHLGFDALRRWYSLHRYPYVTFRGPRDSLVNDVVAADFTGDGQNELFLARGTLQSALQERDPSRWDIYLRPGGGEEQGFALSAAGPLALSIETPEFNPEIRVGAAGIPGSPIGAASGYLDPSNPVYVGSPPRLDSTVTTLYLGLDTVNNLWEIAYNSLHGGSDMMLRLESDGPMVLDRTWGFVPDQPGYYPHIMVREDSGFVEQGIARGFSDKALLVSALALDVDLDQDLDLFWQCGAMFPAPNQLWLNDGSGHFTRVATHGAEGVAAPFDSLLTEPFGAAVPDVVVSLDADGDGDLDLFSADGASRFGRGHYHLWRNDQASGNHWLAMDLVGVKSNPAGIGADVVVYTPGHAQRRTQDGGMHRMAQNHARLHWGLGANEQIDSAVIRWPSGTVQRLETLAADRVWRIEEPVPCLAALPLATEWMGADSVRFTWRSVAGATEYKLSCWVDSGQASDPPFVFTSDTSAMLAGLLTGVRYGWKIRAFCPYGDLPFVHGTPFRLPAAAESLNLAAYPNPATDLVHVVAAGGGAGIWNLLVRNAAGKVVANLALSPSGEPEWPKRRVSLDTRAWPAGAYRLDLVGAEGSRVSRTLVVVRGRP